MHCSCLSPEASGFIEKNMAVLTAWHFELPSFVIEIG
jgi:hypothetical protein